MAMMPSRTIRAAPMNHTPTLEQHAVLASLDRETKLAVARAYRARRQLGESNSPAMLAAIEAFRAARPGASDVEASRAVVLIIARAAQTAPRWFWRDVGAVTR
jgi:hypothetical protein